MNRIRFATLFLKKSLTPRETAMKKWIGIFFVLISAAALVAQAPAGKDLGWAFPKAAWSSISHRYLRRTRGS